MAELYEIELQRWLDTYGITKRHIFLHPYMLAYEGHKGTRVMPIEDVVYNTDCDVVDGVKYKYFSSKTFGEKSKDEQLMLLATYGVSERLKTLLLRTTRFRGLLA